MTSDILEKVSMDLLSIPPLIFRAIRTKITKTTLSEIDINITPHHFEIIKLLEEEGTLHASEIGERLQIAKAQMTKLIDRLVELNMIERKMAAADRRTYNITLTDGAREVLETHKSKVMNAVQEIVSNLTDEELDDLSHSLRKLRNILSRNTADSVSR
jgi:DNA-binding MarR family transcriptional regulator